MKSTLFTSSTFVLFAPLVLGHWNFERLIVNDEVIGDRYQYIRRTNNSNHPLEDIYSIDMRCNSGGASGADTSTYTVHAGDVIGFSINETFGHPGIQQVYLSRAPGLAADYDGSGDWAKLYTATTQSNETSNITYGGQGIIWATHNVESFLFELPLETPPGEYLLRAESIALHAAHKLNKAQFYVGCAQLNIISDGTGTLGPLIQFPGSYSNTDPGILIPEFWSSLKNYTEPGPPLWPEGTDVVHNVTVLPALIED